jgi:outer membrane protein OmpA-like peptidoglycan-associated protein
MAADERFGIFYATRDGDGEPWSEPRKMPAPINSEYSEFGPIILADNITLIFSSTRPGGYGSYDLYKVEKQFDGTWTAPVNLGSFINTAYEDKLITIPASGDILYYAKALPGGKEIYRIQSIPIPEKLQQSKVLTFSGTVMDERDTGKKLLAQVTITDVKNDAKSMRIKSNSDDGKFMVILNKGRSYDIAVKSPGYTFYSTRIDLTNLEHYREMRQDILLEPLIVGAKIILNNMFFETRSYKILQESKYELRRVIDLLKENPGMKLEISGHTDTVGTMKYNMTLSQKRALSVMEYLVNMGISNDRFIARGYGPSKPIDDNATEAGRMKNRRVEISIISM